MITPRRARLALLAILLPLTLVLYLANLRLAAYLGESGDFNRLWTSAQAWLRTGEPPYMLSASAWPDGGAAAAQAPNPFADPLPILAFVLPLASFPIQTARAIWMTLLELSLPLSAAFSLAAAAWSPSRGGKIGFVLFAVLWYHGFSAMLLGQFAVLASLCLLAGLWLIRRQRHISAGLLMALSMVKVQFSWPTLIFVAMWAVSKRHWTLLISLTAGAAALFGSFIAFEPGWLVRWILQLATALGSETHTSAVEMMSQAVPGLSGLNLWIAMVAMIVYLLWEWINAWGQSLDWFFWTCGLTLTLTQALAFTESTAGYAVLILPLSLVFAVWKARWGRRGDAAAMVALLALLLLPWGVFLATAEGTGEPLAVRLPAPALTLVGLWWVRWWAIRPAKPASDSRMARPEVSA